VFGAQEILTVEPTNVEALTSYGILLGKHVKEYELAEQVCRCCALGFMLLLLLHLPMQACFRREPCRVLTYFLLARLPCQILRLAVHQRPRDRSLIILHLHAQGSSFAASELLARAPASTLPHYPLCRSLAGLIHTDPAHNFKHVPRACPIRGPTRRGLGQ
jgi:hypothetical protein